MYVVAVEVLRRGITTRVRSMCVCFRGRMDDFSTSQPPEKKLFQPNPPSLPYRELPPPQGAGTLSANVPTTTAPNEGKQIILNR